MITEIATFCWLKPQAAGTCLCRQAWPSSVFQHQPTAPRLAKKWNWRSQAHLFRGIKRANPQSSTPAMCSWGHENKTRYATLLSTSDFGPFFICKRHRRKIIYFMFFFDEHINSFQIIHGGEGVTQPIGRDFTWFLSQIYVSPSHTPPTDYSLSLPSKLTLLIFKTDTW